MAGEGGEKSTAGDELDFGATPPRRLEWGASAVTGSRGGASDPPAADVSGSPDAGAGYADGGAGGTSPAEADRRAEERKDSFESRPELFAAGAFVGAFVFAKLLKRLSGGD